MDTKPDTIKISAFHREEIFASHANLYVTVKGSSVVSGNEAMKKAKEVSQLVGALTSFGLSSEAVQLMGVRIETSSGTLLKSSSASYHLRIRAEKLDQLAELLDIIASQKNASLERIEWKYPEEAAREHGLESAIARGKVKAEKVAASLGVKLLGVYDFMESTFDEDRPPMPFQAMEMRMKSRAEVADEPGLNMDIQHSKTIQVNVEIWYRISSF
ncbi:MAG TPA: SIMPL domain-containing protein [Anaerolineales bacterium]|nr:SIMPL domain-containing protein [Anaerolineales bacterium]